MLVPGQDAEVGSEVKAEPERLAFDRSARSEPPSPSGISNFGAGSRRPLRLATSARCSCHTLVPARAGSTVGSSARFGGCLACVRGQVAVVPSGSAWCRRGGSGCPAPCRSAPLRRARAGAPSPRARRCPGGSARSGGRSSRRGAAAHARRSRRGCGRRSRPSRRSRPRRRRGRAEQQGGELLAAGLPADADHDAVGGLVLLHQDHGLARAEHVGEPEPLRDHAVETRRLEPVEPRGGGVERGRRG